MVSFVEWCIAIVAIMFFLVLILSTISMVLGLAGGLLGGAMRFFGWITGRSRNVPPPAAPVQTPWERGRYGPQ